MFGQSLIPARSKAADNRTQSRRSARIECQEAVAKRLECGRFSAAFARSDIIHSQRQSLTALQPFVIA